MRRSFARSRRRTLWASSLATVALLAASGCGRGAEAPRQASADSFPGAPVILISIDTLRSDRLPIYGYQGVETPAIDALRDDGVLFERAYSHYPLTLPSHASMFTGLLPTRHGVRDNVGYILEAESLPYLPRELQEAGYATGAAVSSFVLRQETGIGAHFDHYEDAIETREGVGMGNLQRRGGETLRLALEWVESVRHRPFFLFFHIFEPHTPYTPPEPFASRYSDPYDGEVAAADAVVGELLEALRRDGLYDRAIIVLLSDHGEGLGDHGEEEHGILLYREVTQVPLVVKLPGGRRAGEAVSTSVQLADLFPTLLELLGRPSVPDLDGASLFRVAAAGEERPIYAETFYPRLHYGWSELFALIEGDHYYIEGPDPELYDLSRDFAQTENILRQERSVYARLRDALAGLKRPLEMPGEVDPETAQKLAALGYLASGPVAPEGRLPDPKTRIHVLADLQDAQRLLKEGHPAAAVERFRAILADNPHMQDAMEQKAHALVQAGRPLEAVTAYQRALENSGGAAHVALELSSLYQRLGRLEEAEEHARLGLRTAAARAHQQLAALALAREDLATAEREVRSALEHRGSRVEPLLAAVEVLARRGKVEEARGYLRQAERELERVGRQSPPRGFHLSRGDLMGREGDLEQAARDLRREIELFPDSLAAHSRLAMVHALQGRGDLAVATLREMVESQETPAAYAEAVKALRLLGDPGSAAGLLHHALERHPGNEQLLLLQAGA